jgi:hypothetical protein
MPMAGNHDAALYIVGDLSNDRAALLASSGPDRLSVVLIQKAVTATNVPAASVKVLEEDLRRQQGTSSYPSVTYVELLDMIFEADRVAVL